MLLASRRLKSNRDHRVQLENCSWPFDYRWIYSYAIRLTTICRNAVSFINIDWIKGAECDESGKVIHYYRDVYREYLELSHACGSRSVFLWKCYGGNRNLTVPAAKSSKQCIISKLSVVNFNDYYDIGYVNRDLIRYYGLVA